MTKNNYEIRDKNGMGIAQLGWLEGREEPQKKGVGKVGEPLQIR